MNRKLIAENVVDCMLVASESVVFEWLLVNLDVLCRASESWTTLEMGEIVRRLDREFKGDDTKVALALYIMQPTIRTNMAWLKVKRVVAENSSY